jgi:hypothetical protein
MDWPSYLSAWQVEHPPHIAAAPKAFLFHLVAGIRYRVGSFKGHDDSRCRDADG